MSPNQGRKRNKAKSGWQTERKDYSQLGGIMEGSEEDCGEKGNFQNSRSQRQDYKSVLPK